MSYQYVNAYFVLQSLFTFSFTSFEPAFYLCCAHLFLNLICILHFPRIHGATVTLLIGADAPEIFCMQSICKGTRGQPIAVETPLGWSLLGPSLSFATSKNCSVNFVKSDPVFKSQISSLWETDFGNDTSVFSIPTSREDRVAYDIMSKSVNYIAGHYHLPLLWRSDVELPEESIVMASF